MKKNILLRLQALSNDVLAEALFDLAKQSDDAKLVVDRLTRTSDEAYKSTKRAISALNRSTRFIEWRDMPSFARRLESIVEDIDTIEITEEQRFDLICRFYETDVVTFDRIDDSSGYVGHVYQISAQIVFNQCACRMSRTNQGLVAKKLEQLLISNDYGVRDGLLDKVITYLDDVTNRELIKRFSSLSDQVKEIYEARAWLHHIMRIASHLKDTKLFELSALESVADFDEVPVATKFEIASNYFDSDDFERAKNWMDKIDDGERFMLAERNRFLVVLHSKLGNHAERDRIALSEFRRDPSAVALEVLLKTIGEQHRSTIFDEQLGNINAETKFCDASLAFLIDTECLDSASQYTIRNQNSINGDHYWNLPEQGKLFLASGFPLAAMCIYRALLDSILRRGKTKTYSYGVRYLIILDKLSNTALVEGMADHATYKKGVIQLHGKKHSFWKKYETACVV